jgi:HEAT repeat protein
MDDLDLFSRLKESFGHPDYRVKEFNFDNLAKFHRPDFIPLYIEFYKQASREKKNKIIERLEDFSSVDLIPYFKEKLTTGLDEDIFNLIDHLIFRRFSTAKEEILDFALSMRESRFKARAVPALLDKIDPFVFFKALEALNDSVPDVRKHALDSLSKLVLQTWKRIKTPSEPNLTVLTSMYQNWESHILSELKNKDLSEEQQKNTRRLFYTFANNRHSLIKPFLRKFFEHNFHETYFVIKEWPFNEQFAIFEQLVLEDPSFATLLLTVIQGHPDQNLWKIILKLLDSLDEDDRFAFRKILLTRNQNISLEQFLNDNDANVRAAALELALDLKSNGFVDLAKRACKDPSPKVRLKALQCLSQQNFPQYKEYLKEALSDPDEEINFFALRQLKSVISANKMAPFLARFINSDSKPIREFALKEIAELSKKKYKANFNNLKPEIRKLAAKVIQKIDNNFSDQIIADLSSLEPQTRLQAARLLENIQLNEKGKDALLKAMKDPSKLVRAAVVKTLGVMGDPDLIKHLISFFNDPDTRVRANTIEAIASLGDRQAIQTLLPFLDDSNNRIRANAVVGIWKIGQINVIPVLRKMLEPGNNNMQASAIWAIGEIGDSNLLNFVYPFLNNRNDLLRYNAIKTISRIKPELLKPYLPRLRQDTSNKIRKLVTQLSFKVM